jgi:predicted RND superfamily exporter protein
VIARVVQAVVRHRLIVLAVWALVMTASVLLVRRLHLVTDFAELLPGDDPAVVATRQLQQRLGGVTPLQIAIESPDKQANLRFAAALTAALAHEPRSLVDRVAYDLHAERAFFERNWWLYLDLADLELVKQRLDREVRRKNPLFVDLDEDDGSLADLETRVRGHAHQLDRFPEGYFMSPDGTLVVVAVWPPESVFREHAGEALMARIRQVVAAQPALHPAMRVEYAGSIYDAILERHALESDLAWSSGICLVLVGLVVAVFFGRLRAVPLIATPALCGVVVALAVAELAFGQLNASTAFLGSIILGNGINAAIIQLARYEEERRAGTSLALALERSVTGTIRATGIASLAAAIAYGSLIATQFRGFSQFGVIGAVGMVTAWLATILVLPAVLATCDRKRGLGHLRRGLAFGVPFAKLASRAPRGILVGWLVVSCAASVVLVGYLRDPFEYDLRRLRSEEGVARRALGKRIEAIFGSLTPTILLADRFEQTPEIAAALRTRSELAGQVVGPIVTLDTLLPGAPTAQRTKLVVIDAIRRVLHDQTRQLTDDERAKLAKWDPPADLSVVTARELPDAAARMFRDREGAFTPMVVAYKADGTSYWDGRYLERLASIVRVVELRDGTQVHGGGNAVVFAAMLEAITEDGPTATILSFLGVALLVVLLARGARGAAVVLAALVTGVVWMAGAAALAGVRINFLNFIALPLTFGIGVDYAINVYLRHRLEGPGRIVETLRATGGAVALCSLTTTIGYASLLLADSQALRSFGALAILGEVACLAVALVVLPAWLLLGERARPR